MAQRRPSLVLARAALALAPALALTGCGSQGGGAQPAAPAAAPVTAAGDGLGGSPAPCVGPGCQVGPTMITASPTSPTTPATPVVAVPVTSVVPTPVDALLAQAFQAYGVRSVAATEFLGVTPAQVALGQKLFDDTLLSASGRLACSTCHIEQLGTANVFSLQPTGFVLTGQKTGGFLASDLLPRNVPGLFNLGHASVTALFWDGRVQRDPTQSSGFDTPAGGETPPGLSSVLAAQALFPLVNTAEMGCSLGAGGQALAQVSDTQQWSAVLARVLANPQYPPLFSAAFPEVQGGAFGIQHLANAIAAFESAQWRSTNAPFDRYVAGDFAALTPPQKAGAVLFYGKANCATCHSGPLQTDGAYHATGVPQFGPGAGDGPRGDEDFGRGRVTGNPADRYAFRTPSLRNVATTGPWGHDGAWNSLNPFVLHYTNPVAAYQAWAPADVSLPGGFATAPGLAGAFGDPAASGALLGAINVPPAPLSGDEVGLLVEFLLSLTDASVAQNVHSVVVQGGP